MLSFASDYVEGAHPAILQRFIETNLVKQAGYGSDEYTASAREKIKAACGRENLDVHFLAGGTQTNKIVIDAMLHPVQGVIAATTGHIAAHEAGAIEASGHKVLTVPGHEGKVKACEVEALIKAFYNDASYTHMVFPGMVYISHPTEYGTLYTKDELVKIIKRSASLLNVEIDTQDTSIMYVTKKISIRREYMYIGFLLVFIP